MSAVVGEARAVADVLAPFMWPASVTFLCTFGVEVATHIALGRVSAISLAASLLGATLCDILGLCTISGVLSAQDTLSSQAFGAKAHQALGDVLQRATVVCLALSLPTALAWAHSESFLLGFHHPEELAALASRFSMVMVAGLVPRVLTDALRRFLQAQGVFGPQALASTSALLVHLAVLHVLVFRLSLGVVGGALANVVAAWVQFAILALYVRSRRPYHPSSWTGWSWRTLRHDWHAFRSLAVPGAVMATVEQWTLGLLALRAGAFGFVHLDASGTLMLLAVAARAVAVGLATAVQTVLGNALGANQPRSALSVAAVGMGLAVGLAGVLCAVLGNVHVGVGSQITGNTTSASLALELRQWLLVFVALNTLQVVGQGVLVGAGRQAIGAFVLVLCCYGAAVPSSWLLSRLNGLHGLWTGLCFGFGFVLFGVLGALAGTDWGAAVQQARERVDMAWKSLAQSEESGLFGIGSDDEGDGVDDEDEDEVDQRDRRDEDNEGGSALPGQAVVA